MKKKFLLVTSAILTTLVLGVIFISPTPASAADPWSPGYDMATEYEKALKSGPNLVSWIANLYMYILETVNYSIGGSNKWGKKLSTKESAGSNGALGLLGIGLGMVLTAPPPANTVTYLADINPLAKPVYAQGGGATILSFVLDLWKIVRNIAYAFITVILVVVGFMIMFRAKSDPRTEVTLMMALPKIVMVILLITFSYAISALIVDIAAVATGLVKNLVSSLPGYNYQNFNAVDIWKEFGVKAFMDVVRASVEKIKSDSGIPLLGFGLMVHLVFNFALFSVMIGLLMKLIICYAKWFALTVLSPFSFLWGAIPGQEEQIGNWFKSFLAATLSFPAVYLVLNIALYLKFLGDIPGRFAGPHVQFFMIDGLVDDPATPINEVSEVMADLIFFGLVLMAKEIPDMIAKLFIERPDDSTSRELAGALKKIPIVGGFVS